MVLTITNKNKNISTINNNLCKILVSTDCKDKNECNINKRYEVQEKVEIKEEKKLNKETSK